MGSCDMRCEERPAARGGERGLTLIEILLALIVMVLGVVGILALFPPAMDAAKESMEKTQAAILGESVANAISNAAKFAEVVDVGGGKKRYKLKISHDSKEAGGNKATLYIDVMLPELDPSGKDEWYHFPAKSGAVDGWKAPFPMPEDPMHPLWVLTGDPWTSFQSKEIQDNVDGSEPLHQFGFSFDVRKVNTLAHLVGTAKSDGKAWTIADLDALVKVWEFRIHTFRIKGGADDGGTTAGGAVERTVIATLSTRVTIR